MAKAKAQAERETWSVSVQVAAGGEAGPWALMNEIIDQGGASPEDKGAFIVNRGELGPCDASWYRPTEAEARAIYAQLEAATAELPQGADVTLIEPERMA